MAPWITLKSVYLKITLSRFTLAFFLFSFIHCFAEGILQAFIFSQDSTASDVATSILHQAKVPLNNFGVLIQKDGKRNNTLDICNNLRPDIDNPPCQPVFQTGVPNLPLPTNFNLTTNIFLEGIEINPNANGGPGVDVVLNDKQTVRLNQMCTLVLTYPHQIFMNQQREDIVLVLSQFWIFAVSFFAVVYDSVPHLIAALMCRSLATGWAMYMIIWRITEIQERFDFLLSSQDSPCLPLKVDQLFPGYFAARRALAIPDVILNIIALLLCTYLSLKLIKVYSANTFNRVGAPPAIIRIYRYFLAVFVSFQVAALLLVSTVCLWLDNMLNRDNAMSGFTYHRSLYIALSIFTIVFLVPWITTGWYAVRREWKRLMIVFLVLATIVFASWVLMLKSWSFQYTYVNWPFFSIQYTAASLSLLSTMIFGIISFFHFDKGLAHYLYVDDELAKAGFEPELFEKDVEKGAKEDWREIGLDDIPTYTLKFSVSGDKHSDTGSK